MAFSLIIFESPCSLFCLLAILILHSLGSQCINFLVVGTSEVGGNETDYLALLDFKARLTHDPLGVTSSWNSTTHFCYWQGVTCGRRHKRVTILDLHSLKLSGSISKHIGNLSFLREINLQDNSFNNEIPSSIGRLRRLQIIYMRNNLFSGKIPANISGCTALSVFDIAVNKLIGEIPVELGSLLKLEIISINANNLTGSIPSFENSSSLKVLSISQNGLVGSIPDALGKHKNIEWLALGVNMLSGTIPLSIFNLSSMKIFNVIYNQIQGSLPADLGINLPRIQSFSISRNQITGSIPNYISNMSYLERLQMAGNKLTGNVPSFKKLNKLQIIIISNNSLGSSGADDLSFLCSLTNSTSLDRLDIDNNYFRGMFPECITNLSTNLTQLKLGNNQMDGQIPSSIGNFINLEVLDMSRNQFSGNIPPSIGKLLKLKLFSLRRNKLSGNLPLSLGNLKMLIEMYLNDNNLQGTIPSSLGNCKNLVQLLLSDNNFNGTIPSEVIGLSSLSISFDLSRNQLSGPLPIEVGNLKNLGILDLSDNFLSGKIPSSLGSCIKLEILRMHGNFIEGTIPSSLISLRGIEELDLSRNNLSGQIPEFLAGLGSLRTLNLSLNDFEGVLPVEGVFKNASAVSVKGNTKLCGGIPDFHLPVCQLKNSKRRHSNNTLKIIIPTVSGFLGLTFLLSLLHIWRLRKARKELTSSTSENSLLFVSYQSLLKATREFSSANLIGSGSFGSVYKGILDEGRTIIAVKVINLLHRGADKSFIAECEALRNIRHRNLVKLFTACSSIDHHGNDFKALVYEFMVNGSLDEWLHQSCKTNETQEAPRTLNFIQRLNIAIDVACALEYLHYQCQIPIVHCDLKPSNVLLDDEMVGHVGDFGLARFLQEATYNQTSSVGVRGSIGYTAPEYGMGSKLSTYGDVYSYGILLLEMFTGKRPTDDMLKDNLNLHNFVKASWPEQLAEVTDPILIQEIEHVESRISKTLSQSSKRNNKVLESLVSIFGIGVTCSSEFPIERMNMNVVATKLQVIRKELLENGFSGVQCKDI